MHGEAKKASTRRAARSGGAAAWGDTNPAGGHAEVMRPPRCPQCGEIAELWIPAEVHLGNDQLWTLYPAGPPTRGFEVTATPVVRCGECNWVDPNPEKVLMPGDMFQGHELGTSQPVD